MKTFTLTIATIGLLAAAAANAEVSGSVTGAYTSDYDFRGVSQSAGDPAAQGSLDLEGSSGWYLGVWGSKVDFGSGDSTDLELDWYAGFSMGETWVTDFGITYYAYPNGDDLNYTELYAGIEYAGAENWGAGFKQWYSWDWFGIDNTDGYYSELNGHYMLPWFDIGLSGHVGYTWGDGPDDFYDTYTDYSVGVFKKWWGERIETHVRWVDTDISGDLEEKSGAFENDGRVIGHISITFP